MPCMTNIHPYKAYNLHIDLLGNTHPLKVDRNLQWMSHYPANPTYNPVLSGTMTQLSAQCHKEHHQDTQYKCIHTKGVYQMFDILYATIVIMIHDMQYLQSVMQNRPK